jgi:hypothetical protein
LIGFDSRNEETIQKIVELIPNRIVFDSDFTKDEIMESFTTTQVIRQIKLIDILNESGNVNIILNLNNLQNEGSNTPGFFRIKDLVNSLNSKLYQISNDNRNIKLILLSSIYQSSSGNFQIKGGTSAIPVSDYCVMFNKDELIVIKDRESMDESKIKISNLIFE